MVLLSIIFFLFLVLTGISSLHIIHKLDLVILIVASYMAGVAIFHFSNEEVRIPKCKHNTTSMLPQFQIPSFVQFVS